jgi:hypothetical protein
MKEATPMKPANKHGYPIRNLRAVSRATVDNPAGYSQISYDTQTGELLEAWHVGTPLTSWTDYHDPNIIWIMSTHTRVTMQQLADAVQDAMVCREYLRKEGILL